MKMKKYVKVTFSGLAPESLEVLSAALSIQTDLGTEEVDSATLNAYFEEADLDLKAIEELSTQFKAGIEIKSFYEENWNAQWESTITPIQVRDFCIIRASFHEAPNEVEYDIVITPKMSFGTGHHATTYQILDKMESIDFKRKRVLDFGTGTGVLGILAKKMGANEVVAIDNDHWSIENAAECAQENGVEWMLIQGSLGDAPEGEYEVILANINLHILMKYADRLLLQLTKGGDLLISGILMSDVLEIKECFEEHGGKLKSQTEKEGWVMMHWSK